MSERTIELDQPVLTDETADALREATDRAERAEAELAKLKAQMAHSPAAAGQPHQATHAADRPSHTPQHSPAHSNDDSVTPHAVTTEELKQPPSPSSAHNAPEGYNYSGAPAERGSANRAEAEGDGEDELRKDPMMAHLLDSLNGGTDIGHYGRLTFAMVARHFMPHEQVIGWLTRDSDFSRDQAEQMLHQVDGRDYSPPRRERLLQWQREQEFQFIDADDPDSGNLYRNLTFPEAIYEHIGHYQEAKTHS